MNKPKNMSQEAYEKNTKELRETINYLFLSTEILDHAFTDFMGVAKRLGLDTHEYKQNINRITHSIKWFREWYTDAFKRKDNEVLIDAFGEMGDILNEKLKQFYLNYGNENETD